MSLLTFNSLNLPSARVPHRWPASATHVHTFFGQDVLWCPSSRGGSHLSEDQLEPYRQIGDPIVDHLLERLDQEGAPLTGGSDLLSLIERVEHGEEESTLSQSLQDELVAFLTRYRTVPAWVDVEQLQRGQHVFVTYAPAMGAALYYRSLVAGFSIPRIAAVIQSTGYLAPPARPEQVRTRLYDTGALLGACMTGGMDSVYPNGSGWKAALRVRVLHAKVRRCLLKRKTWDKRRLGVPINQEDMAATLLAFSVNTLLGVEFVAGVQVSRQEQLDYIALWRYIGWLMGVHTLDDELFSENLRPLDPCGPGWYDTVDPIRHSQSMLQSIIIHLMKPDQSSVLVAHHLLKIGRSKQEHEPKKTLQPDAWFYFRSLQCRRFIGDPLADALQLPMYNVWWKRVLLLSASTLYLSLLRVYLLASMYIPPARRRIRRWHQESLTKFHENWTKSHSTRMAKAFRKAEDKAAPSIQSSCPFAMVAPPRY